MLSLQRNRLESFSTAIDGQHIKAVDSRKQQPHAHGAKDVGTQQHPMAAKANNRSEHKNVQWSQQETRAAADQSAALQAAPQLLPLFGQELHSASERIRSGDDGDGKGCSCPMLRTLTHIATAAAQHHADGSWRCVAYLPEIQQRLIVLSAELSKVSIQQLRPEQAHVARTRIMLPEHASCCPNTHHVARTHIMLPEHTSCCPNTHRLLHVD